MSSPSDHLHLAAVAALRVDDFSTVGRSHTSTEAQLANALAFGNPVGVLHKSPQSYIAHETAKKLISKTLMIAKDAFPGKDKSAGSAIERKKLAESGFYILPKERHRIKCVRLWLRLFAAPSGVK